MVIQTTFHELQMHLNSSPRQCPQQQLSMWNSCAPREQQWRRHVHPVRLLTHTERRQAHSTPPRAGSQESIVDQDFIEELNIVSNRTLEAICSGQEQHAEKLSLELGEMLQYLQQENDLESCRFIRVLQGLLDHTVLKEAENLEGMYATAVNRILNQAAGSDWRLLEEGKAAVEEPSFSTWDDVFGDGKQKATQPSSRAPDNLTYYRLLGIDPSAALPEIKAAYRQLALKLHPDVNAAPDASERFAEISGAYDVLSNETSRSLYDKYGPEMGSRRGADSGKGNARAAWDEFKPHVRENKHTRARASSAPTSSGGESSSTDGERLPQVGDVVEYPLRDVEMEDYGDGRTHGVGLLVGRNMDRGDVATLPVDRLGICEVEPLRQEEPDSPRWIADELGISSFARLEDMKVVPIAEFDSRRDVWTITASLSPGCGGPALPEEIIF